MLKVGKITGVVLTEKVSYKDRKTGETRYTIDCTVTVDGEVEIKGLDFNSGTLGHLLLEGLDPSDRYDRQVIQDFYHPESANLALLQTDIDRIVSQIKEEVAYGWSERNQEVTGSLMTKAFAEAQGWV